MTKKGLLVLAVVALLAMTALPAFAGINWCAEDPHVVLPNGNVVDIDVGVPVENQSDPVFLFIRAPRGSHLSPDMEGTIPLQIFFSPTARRSTITVIAIPSGMYPVMLKISENGQVLKQKVGHPGHPVHLFAHVQ